jgi:hypothetical protein
MQQVQIPVSPVVNISVISTSWRKVRTGCTFFQFLYDSSRWCLARMLKVSSVMPVQHVPICASICVKIFILSLIVNYFRVPLLSIFNPLAVKFALMDNKIWSLRSEVKWALEDLRI